MVVIDSPCLFACVSCFLSFQMENNPFEKIRKRQKNFNQGTACFLEKENEEKHFGFLFKTSRMCPDSLFSFKK